MNDNVPILKGIGNPTDEPLGSLRCSVDRNKSERTFGTTSHFEDDLLFYF